MNSYNNIDALLAPVKNGAVAPVSGKYLLKLAAGKHWQWRVNGTCKCMSWCGDVGHNLDAGDATLQRRQELPKRAFYVPDERAVARVDPTFQKFMFVALSYRWLSKGHPDPSGFHLKIVAHFVKKHLDYSASAGVTDVAMFWDFGSLHQKPRTVEQHELFDQGLKASNIWYGSANSVVWLQSHLPRDFVGATYDESGWCFVEASISSIIKDTDARWNLGRVQIDDLGNVLSMDGHYALEKMCTTNRLPPLPPNKVRQMLGRDKTFTNKSDVKTVADLYETFFADISTAATELQFSDAGWTAHHMRDFVEALPMFTQLEVLNLNGNNLQHEGAAILSQSLKANNAITVLQLQMNNIGDEGAVALANGLKANTTITTLSLSGNQIGDKGACALAVALQANNTIKELNLFFNKIGDEGAIQLANGLKANNAITVLNLEVNNIGDEGAVALANGLKANNAIKELNLSYNNIGDEGAVALANGLKANTTMSTLWLNGNQIGDKGACALAVALQASVTLKELWLQNNSMGEEGQAALRKAAEGRRIDLRV